MRAITMTGQPGGLRLNVNQPNPYLRPGHILVRVHAIALNPVDWKVLEHMNVANSVLGADFAGEVLDTGDPTTYTKCWAVGDRIAGFAFGGNALQAEDGAFAEVVLCKADVGIRLPEEERLGWAEAATLGVAVATARGLCREMGLRLPGGPLERLGGVGGCGLVGEKGMVLVYGGSSAMATMAIQVLTL
jgi:NADPH:quinone reductase-like Zn-dependent oxidoreductase